MVRSNDNKNRLHIDIARDFFKKLIEFTHSNEFWLEVGCILKAKNQQDPLGNLNFS